MLSLSANGSSTAEPRTRQPATDQLTYGRLNVALPPSSPRAISNVLPVQDRHMIPTCFQWRAAATPTLELLGSRNIARLHRRVGDGAARSVPRVRAVADQEPCAW